MRKNQLIQKKWQETSIAEILSSKHPQELVRNLPEEEVWFEIKKGSPEQAIELLSYTTKEQLQYMLDIELWKKDLLDEEAAVEWINLISNCGRKKIMEWARETDLGTVVLLLKRFVEVKKRESSDDNPLEKGWKGNLPPVTFDNIYFFQPLNDTPSHAIERIMDTLAKGDYEFYTKICEAIIHELESNLEEEAYSWRGKRLLDKGFVPFDEAASVYKYWSDKEIKRIPGRGGHKTESVKAPPVYPLTAFGEDYPLFMLALAEIKEDELFESLNFEMAALANKMLSAEGRRIRPESVASVLKKAFGYVNIGLEHLSGADPKKAANILKEMWVVHLFQVGYSVVARARQNAKKFITNGWPRIVERDISLLDIETGLIISAVCRQKPIYFCGVPPEKPYRDFRSVDDVREVERRIEEADYIGRLFIDTFRLDPIKLKSVAVDKENISFSVALLTIWANGMAVKDYKLSPLTEAEFAKVLKKVFGKKEFEFFINDFYRWLLKRQPSITNVEERFLKNFVDKSFKRFSEEFSEIDDYDEIDARFVDSVWIIRAAD